MRCGCLKPDEGIHVEFRERPIWRTSNHQDQLAGRGHACSPYPGDNGPVHLVGPICRAELPPFCRRVEVRCGHDIVRHRIGQSLVATPQVESHLSESEQLPVHLGSFKQGSGSPRDGREGHHAVWLAQYQRPDGRPSPVKKASQDRR